MLKISDKLQKLNKILVENLYLYRVCGGDLN